MTPPKKIVIKLEDFKGLEEGEREETHCKQCWIDNGGGKGFCQFFSSCPCHKPADNYLDSRTDKERAAEPKSVTTTTHSPRLWDEQKFDEEFPAQSSPSGYGLRYYFNTAKNSVLWTDSTAKEMENKVKSFFDSEAERIVEKARMDTARSIAIAASLVGLVPKELTNEQDWEKEIEQLKRETEQRGREAEKERIFKSINEIWSKYHINNIKDNGFRDSKYVVIEKFVGALKEQIAFFRELPPKTNDLP